MQHHGTSHHSLTLCRPDRGDRKPCGPSSSGACLARGGAQRGDVTRTWKLKSETAPDWPDTGGVTAYFSCCNLGKQSMACDIRQPEALEVVHRLVEKADVVVACTGYRIAFPCVGTAAAPAQRHSRRRSGRPDYTVDPHAIR